ncbi:MAG: HAD family hydrolase [Promethearchaeota archaeon]
MKLENISAIIFDLGGTLYRPVSDMCGLTRDFLSGAGFGEEYDLSDEAILKAIKGPDEWLHKYMVKNDVDIHWMPNQEMWIEYDRMLLAALGIKDREEIILDYQKQWDRFHDIASPEIVEGCKEGLEELRNRGFKLAVASNRFADPRPLLEDSAILHLFDAVEYTNTPGYKKPSPYLLVKVAAMMEVNPHRCVYVGNIVETDVIAATRAGMIPVLLTWCDPEEEEKITSDTVVIGHINELLEIL